MKVIQPADAPQRLMDGIRLARFKLVKAERQLAEAKAEARLARQRRKAAKLAAREAKKRVKQAEEQVAEAGVALAKLDAQLVRLAPVKRKPRSRSVRKVAVAPGARRAVTTAIVAAGETSKTSKPAARWGKARPEADLAAHHSTHSFSPPEFLVSPIALISPEECKPTAQIIRGVEEIFTGESAAASSVETVVGESLAPPDQDSCPPSQNVVSAAVS